MVANAPLAFGRAFAAEAPFVIPQQHFALPQFVNQEFSGHGTSEPIVARTTLQTRDLIGAFPLSEEDRNRLVEVAFSVQARLLACKEIADELGKAVADAIGRVGNDGMVSEQNGRLVTIPGVPDLQPRAETFLYQAKLAIRDIGQLYKPLVGQHFDQNFKAFADWALTTWGGDDPLVQMLEGDRPWIGRIISLRDAVEHPTHRRGALHIVNFTLSTSGSLAVVAPAWYQGTEAPVAIVPEMQMVVDSLLHFYEELLAGLLMKLDGASWLEIVAVPESERDTVIPMRLRAVPRFLPPEV